MQVKSFAMVAGSIGRGLDFIFRYCNAEMANVEGVPVEEMLDHSFYEIFRNGDKKWLVAYADVALNGGNLPDSFLCAG